MNYSPISTQASDSLRNLRQLASLADALAKDVLFETKGKITDASQRVRLGRAARTLCAIHCVDYNGMPKFRNAEATAEEYVETFFAWLDAELKGAK